MGGDTGIYSLHGVVMSAKHSGKGSTLVSTDMDPSVLATLPTCPVWSEHIDSERFWIAGDIEDEQYSRHVAISRETIPRISWRLFAVVCLRKSDGDGDGVHAWWQYREKHLKTLHAEICDIFLDGMEESAF